MTLLECNFFGLAKPLSVQKCRRRGALIPLFLGGNLPVGVKKKQNSTIAFRIDAKRDGPLLLNTKMVGSLCTLLSSLPLFPTWQWCEQKVQHTCAFKKGKRG